ncbi:MAG: ParB/RepB/Spo0J family partition protein [Anaerotardibacter sp.]
MAKQKSGLGKGIGALFGESDVTFNQPAAAPKEPKQEVNNKPLNKPRVAPTNPVPTNAVKDTNKEQPVNNSSAAQTEQKPEEAKKTSEIFISDDALQSARVVEREAKTTSAPQINNEVKRPTTRKTPLKTAPIKPFNSFSQQNTAANTGEKQEVKKETLSFTSNGTPRSTEAGSVATKKETAPIPGNQTFSPTSTPAEPAVKKSENIDVKGAITEVPLSDVEPNPEQPRTNFKPEEIEELANSIKQEGLLQPILVRKVNNKYQIIAGERRWQACKSIGMETIPVRFWLADNDKALELALVENIQRSDLNPIEEAYGYKRLMERRGMTQSEVAQTVSKGRSTIANALRLLDLPEEAQQLLFEEKITAGHARAILSIPTEEGRKKLTNKLMEQKLSVREAEAIANLLKGNGKEKESTNRLVTPPSFKRAAKNLSIFFSVPVRVKNSKGKNKIEIQFKDEEELNRILELIKKNSEE